MERITWFDAIEYCNKLSEQEGLTPAYTISGTGKSRTASWNQKGEASGSCRVLRGGSWYDNGRYIRSAYRNSSSPFLRSHSVSFRLARS